MPYSTQADVQQEIGGAERLAQLLDWDGNGVIDDGVLDRAIAKADALIDSFAGKIYTVPFSPVPPIIVTTSAELAILIVRRQRPGGLGPSDELRYEQIAGQDGWLFRLSRGIVTPGGDPLPTKHSTMSPDGATTELSPERELSRCKLRGFW